MKRLLKIVLIILSLVVSGFGQGHVNTSAQALHPPDELASLTAVTVDHNGGIYAAGHTKEFMAKIVYLPPVGTEWQIIDLPNNAFVTALFWDVRGDRLIVGMQGGILSYRRENGWKNIVNVVSGMKIEKVVEIRMLNFAGNDNITVAFQGGFDQSVFASARIGTIEGDDLFSKTSEIGGYLDQICISVAYDSLNQVFFAAVQDIRDRTTIHFSRSGGLRWESLTASPIFPTLEDFGEEIKKVSVVENYLYVLYTRYLNRLDLSQGFNPEVAVWDSLVGFGYATTMKVNQIGDVFVPDGGKLFKIVDGHITKNWMLDERFFHQDFFLLPKKAVSVGTLTLRPSESAATIKAAAYNVYFERKDIPEVVIPEQFVLEQNYPNPFNPATTISYQLASEGLVTIKIFDLRGREVKTLVDETQGIGFRAVTWNGQDDHGLLVSSGVYFYKLTAGNFKQTRKMMLVK